MGWMKLPEDLLYVHGTKPNSHLEMIAFKGIVMGNATWAETRVHSSGGGVYGSTVVLPQVNSSVTENREFFLRDGGDETSFHFRNAHFPVREGHEITVIWGIPKGAKKGDFILAKNHTTGEAHDFGVSDEQVNGVEPGTSGCLGIVLALLGLPMQLGWLAGGGGALVALLGLAALAYGIVLVTRRVALVNATKQAVARRAADILAHCTPIPVSLAPPQPAQPTA